MGPGQTSQEAQEVFYCRYPHCPRAAPSSSNEPDSSSRNGFTSKKHRARHEASHDPKIQCEWQASDGTRCPRMFSRIDNMKDHVSRVHVKNQEGVLDTAPQARSLVRKVRTSPLDESGQRTFAALRQSTQMPVDSSDAADMTIDAPPDGMLISDRIHESPWLLQPDIESTERADEWTYTGMQSISVPTFETPAHSALSFLSGSSIIRTGEGEDEGRRASVQGRDPNYRFPSEIVHENRMGMMSAASGLGSPQILTPVLVVLPDLSPPGDVSQYLGRTSVELSGLGLPSTYSTDVFLANLFGQEAPAQRSQTSAFAMVLVWDAQARQAVDSVHEHLEFILPTDSQSMSSRRLVILFFDGTILGVLKDRLPLDHSRWSNAFRKCLTRGPTRAGISTWTQVSSWQGAVDLLR